MSRSHSIVSSTELFSTEYLVMLVKSLAKSMMKKRRCDHTQKMLETGDE
jgi:hypothetical protein